MPVTVTALDASLAPRLRMAVLRLARRLRQQAEAAEVTPTLLSALSTVERAGPLSLGELAAAERVQPPTVSRVVARLEELGLVAREADPADRRVSRVRVTPEGHRYVARSRTRKDAYLARRLRALSPAEQALLAEALPLLERLVEGDDS